MELLIKIFLYIIGSTALLILIVLISKYLSKVLIKIFNFLKRKKIKKDDNGYSEIFEREEKLMRQIEFLDGYREISPIVYGMKIKFRKNNHVTDIKVNIRNYSVETSLSEIFTDEELYFIGLNAARVIEKARTEEEEKKQAEKEMRRINLRKQYLED